MKSDCYTCKNRRTIAGDSHSMCIARTLTQAMKQPSPLYPTFAEHGINMGWAFWPLNFDPVWMDECGLYEEKDGV